MAEIGNQTYGSLMAQYRPLPSSALVSTALLLVVLVGVLAGSGLAAPADQTLVLPETAFNITDHNLTYATNMLTLTEPWNGSFRATFVNSLVAADSANRSAQEAQVAFGPGPAGPEEANITPIFILQESSAGLLRLEYIPFAMTETYGFIVYEGSILPAGASPFSGHTLVLTYLASAPGIAPYPRTVPYGYSTGNVSLSWDGRVLVPQYPIAWANLSAFYGYGLKTDTFASGSLSVTVDAAPGAPTGGSGGASAGSLPPWALAGGIGAVAGLLVGGLAVRAYGRRSRP